MLPQPARSQCRGRVPSALRGNAERVPVLRHHALPAEDPALLCASGQPRMPRRQEPDPRAPPRLPTPEGQASLSGSFRKSVCKPPEATAEMADRKPPGIAGGGGPAPRPAPKAFSILGRLSARVSCCCMAPCIWPLRLAMSAALEVAVGRGGLAREPRPDPPGGRTPEAPAAETKGVPANNPCNPGGSLASRPAPTLKGGNEIYSSVLLLLLCLFFLSLAEPSWSERVRVPLDMHVARGIESRGRGHPRPRFFGPQTSNAEGHGFHGLHLGAEGDDRMG